MTKKFEIMRTFLLMPGNCTMPRYVGIFNLPALSTCRPSEWCKKHCYANKGRFRFSNVRKAHGLRLTASLRDDFVSRRIAEIKKKHYTYIRIHISGDFYSEAYVDKWAAIARAFPDIIFRTNTKRTDFMKHMKKVFPENLIVRESTDTTRKHREIFPQAAIIGTPGSEDFFTCNDECEACNFHCWHNPEVNVVTSQIR